MSISILGLDLPYGASPSAASDAPIYAWTLARLLLAGLLLIGAIGKAVDTRISTRRAGLVIVALVVVVSQVLTSRRGCLDTAARYSRRIGGTSVALDRR